MIKLKEPGTIGRLQLKNRMLMAPMGIHNGDYTQETVDFYSERIRGGASMIICNTYVTDKFEDTSASMLLTQENIGNFRKIVKIAHDNNCLVCPQLMPGCGRVGGPSPAYQVPVSASACDWLHAPGVPCHELTADEIGIILSEFRRTARLAIEAGADAVEIHAYGGYLTDQFLTACWNTRTDEYGGSLEGRMKFLMDMVDILVEEGGSGFPIIVKYSATHDLPAEYGFRGIEEGIEIAKRLEAAGVAALHVDAGCYEDWFYAMPPVYFQEAAPQIRAAAAVRKAVSIPVITHGRLSNISKAEAAIEQGACDFVAIARGLLADPALPAKVISGDVRSIRPCISCNDGCIGQVFAGQPASCAVNPLCGYEGRRQLHKTDHPQKVLVVGAGPGGCSAALMASECGHQVEVWEKGAVVGGKALTASRPYMKSDMQALSEYYSYRLEHKRIPVKLMTEATVESIREYSPDVVIWAAGGKPLLPDSIPGIHSACVVTAEDALNNVVSIGDTVALIGGGLVGCETALHLERIGKKVILVEMCDKLLPTPIFPMNEMMLRMMIEKSSIEVHTGSRLKSVEDGEAVLDAGGEELRIACDTVIMALGSAGTASEADGIRDICRVITIGDSNRMRNIMAAVSEAYEAVTAL